MGRIGSFRREVDNTLAEAREGTDTLARWTNADGVRVYVSVMTYPRHEDSPTGKGRVRVAEYWVCVERSEEMDGSGPDAPFDGVHSQVSSAKDAARDVMREIATEGEDDDGEDPERSTDGGEVMTDGGQDPEDAGEDGERVDDLRDLAVVDEVLFDDRKRPLTVTEDTTMKGESLHNEVALKGPRGGVVTVADRSRRPGGFSGWKTSSDGVVDELIRVSEGASEDPERSTESGVPEPITHVTLYFHLREICQGSRAERNPDGLDEITAREALHSPDPVAFLAAVARDPYRALDARHTAETLLSEHIAPFWFAYRCPECMEAEALLNWTDEDSHEPEPRCPCGREVPVPNYPGEDPYESRSDRGARHAGPRVDVETDSGEVLMTDGGRDSNTDETVQMTLTPAGYCEGYGRLYPFLSPGDGCPLCPEPLSRPPDAPDPEVRTDGGEVREDPEFGTGEVVRYELEPASHVPEDQLNANGKLEHTGEIVNLPGFAGSLGGHPVQWSGKYKIQRKPGVYGLVSEDAILGRVMTDGGEDLETEVVSVGDLSEGDEILFGDRKMPLEVTGEPWKSPMGSGYTVDIEGPRGAEYRLSEQFTSYKRQRSDKPYRYTPKDGDGTNMTYVDEIRRVVGGRDD